LTSVTGTVLLAQGGLYQVLADGEILEAVLRGRVKRDERSGEKVVAGDVVELEPTDASAGAAWAVARVEPRHSVLERKAPGKAPRAKAIVANVDQVVIVFAAARPEPHLRMLDRFLVIASSAELEPLIVVNKVDLAGEAEALRTFAAYRRAGYRLLFTAAKRGDGVAELREALCGRISALTGPSGVGKSSLLNAVQPGLGLRIGEISEALNKGQHTTVTARLIPLECGGFVADTPGLREVGLWAIETDQLQFHFPEFEPLLGSCRYPTCTHVHEPGCAIRAAVDDGDIDASRYESYLRIMRGDDDG
jgi:ribosome biogenesis GTPase / thiamine phosphate phosphatase